MIFSIAVTAATVFSLAVIAVLLGAGDVKDDDTTAYTVDCYSVGRKVYNSSF
jgi:hypothetical protein